MSYSVVATGCNNSIGRSASVKEFNCYLRINLVQQINSKLHKNAVLARRLDQAAVATCDYAKQIEKANKRNITGHNHQYITWGCDGQRRIAIEPRTQTILVEHLSTQSLDGVAYLAFRKPTVCCYGIIDHLTRRGVFAKVSKSLPQLDEKIYDLLFVHATKI